MSNVKSYSKWERNILQKKTNEDIEKKNNTLFKEAVEKTSTKHTLFWETFFLQTFNENKNLPCEGDLGEKELYEAMARKITRNNKLTKKLYESFWEDLKDIFITSIWTTKSKNEFVLSQK